MLAEGGWTHTGILAKGIGKVIRIGIAAHPRDFCYAVRVIEQELLGIA